MPSSTVEFVPPSPGQWELEKTHATRPVSFFMAAMTPEPFRRGFKESMAAYGALLDYLEMATVNGFIYTTPRPVGAPKDAKGHPPRPVFWLLQRLHPEMRRRIKRSREAFATRHWREELRQWDEEVKPEVAREGQSLLAEDLASMSNQALSDHLKRATEFAAKTVYYHHRFDACAILPPADFITHVMAWTGASPGDILMALRGSSPVSSGAVAEVAALGKAIATDPDAAALLQSHAAPGDVLVGLAQRPGVREPLRAYLETAGWRVVGGYDVADRHAREHPELLVNVIRAAVKGNTATPGDGGAAIQSLRSKVPSEHQATFDALLEEARVTYRVRDERNFCCDAIGVGVVRRAILAAGERLKAEGRLADPQELVDATLDEIRALLEGRGGPSPDEITARTKARLARKIEEAPERLGIPPSPPPPAEWLPAPAARLQRAIDVALRLMFEVPQKQEGRGAQLKGFGVSPGVIEAPARVIRDVTELPLVQEGEVLVTPSTGPTFNVVLPLLKGLVTERGGALSHAAIVAREYGIPGVAGCRDAASRIKTGTRVRVDGQKGEVWIID